MAVLHTIQSGWIPLRSGDVSTDEVPLDSSTSGSNLWDLTSKDCVELGPEANGINIFFAINGADGAQDTCHIFGKADGGPAERIAEFSLTAGAAYFEGLLPGESTSKVDSTAYLMVDTIAMDATNEFHIRDVDYFDTANDAAAKLTFDTTGLKFLYVCFTQSATKTHKVIPYGRIY